MKTMLFLLGLFFFCGFLRCDEFEKAKLNGTLGTEHELKGRRNDYIMKDNITNVIFNSTSGTDHMDQLILQYSFLTTLVGDKTDTRDGPPSFIVSSPVSNHSLVSTSPEHEPAHLENSDQGFPLAIRRHLKVFRSESDNRQLMNDAFRQQIPPIDRQGITAPQIGRNIESEAKRLGQDYSRNSKQPVSHRTRHEQTVTTVTKQRLKPGLLLGMATISDVRIPEDIEDLEKISLISDNSKRIMRIQKLPVMTKKKWYSDQTKVPTEQMANMPSTIEKQYFRHIKTAATSQSYTPTVTASMTQSSFKVTETRQEAYMIQFLIELTRLMATKEKKAVHDVVKHTDQIMHGFYKSGQLQWFGQPLIDVTKKLARSLKESEIDDIQLQAANLNHKLKQRQHMLSKEVNMILENADRMYDEYEGEQLLEVLKEFAAYPNVTITGYWLCNSLINNFLRPYRRLTDIQQRQQLMESVNLDLKARFTFSGDNEKSGLRSGDVIQNTPVNETLTQTVPHSEITRTSRISKRKHHHRSHKRKREKTIPDTRVT